ncbi:DUF4267 domain-containing protein [Nocardia carnea]|nr:DUF4267 domain-containing protein [Nocardia carnea]
MELTMITVRRVATLLSLSLAAFVLYFGTGYLIAPEWIATGFGLPVWPTGEAAAFSNLKGVRDVVTAIVLLVLLALGQRFALGVVLLGFALIPVGDMLTVLLHNGSAAAAFGIHGLTAVLVALTGLLLIRERAGVDTAAQAA